MGMKKKNMCYYFGGYVGDIVKMLRRIPLIFKICAICATTVYLGIFLYNHETNVFKYRSVVPTRNTPLSLSTQRDNGPGHQHTTYPTSTSTEVATSATRLKSLTDDDMEEFVLDQPPCDEIIYLMIYIHSAPKNAERRRVIRDTWGSDKTLTQHKARLVFVMGQVSDQDIQTFVENENEVFNDIIQGIFSDTYRKLTFKAIAGLKWTFRNCDNAMYVLKTDDDIVVDIHRLLWVIRFNIEKRWGKTNLLGGNVWTHMNVIRNKRSKWYTSPKEFPKAFFPKYCSGSAYLMSSDVVKKFYLKSRETPFFWIDDYYVTGLLAHAADVNPRNMNDRYILKNDADIMGLLVKDLRSRLMFVHSPNTDVSLRVWQHFLDRW